LLGGIHLLRVRTMLRHRLSDRFPYVIDPTTSQVIQFKMTIPLHTKTFDDNILD
jgi:hypothetical protein